MIVDTANIVSAGQVRSNATDRYLILHNNGPLLAGDEVVMRERNGVLALVRTSDFMLFDPKVDGAYRMLVKVEGK